MPGCLLPSRHALRYSPHRLTAHWLARQFRASPHTVRQVIVSLRISENPQANCLTPTHLISLSPHFVSSRIRSSPPGDAPSDASSSSTYRIIGLPNIAPSLSPDPSSDPTHRAGSPIATWAPYLGRRSPCRPAGQTGPSVTFPQHFPLLRNYTLPSRFAARENLERYDIARSIGVRRNETAHIIEETRQALSGVSDRNWDREMEREPYEVRQWFNRWMKRRRRTESVERGTVGSQIGRGVENGR
jgi:hypothetical protein